jgi:hypothetical protein
MKPVEAILKIEGIDEVTTLRAISAGCDEWGLLRLSPQCSETSALKPYWGKPAVRNFRGGYGNGGIIRSPLSAITLLD